MELRFNGVNPILTHYAGRPALMVRVYITDPEAIRAISSELFNGRPVKVHITLQFRDPIRAYSTLVSMGIL